MPSFRHESKAGDARLPYTATREWRDSAAGRVRLFTQSAVHC